MIPGSKKDHPSFVRSFGYAIEGFVTAVKTERNIKVMLAAATVTVAAGFILDIEWISWALIVICCGLVIFAELCNTAMEAIVDLATQELHPLAKRAKDIAAASVYVLSITAAIVGILVFAHELGFIQWH
ncbi:MAG: diacylglycerol kinase family protein [Collinsella sp.]|nr:diacylglycerol kinase family protein [Collinsella sp.]